MSDKNNDSEKKLQKLKKKFGVDRPKELPPKEVRFYEPLTSEQIKQLKLKSKTRKEQQD